MPFSSARQMEFTSMTRVFSSGLLPRRSVLWSFSLATLALAITPKAAFADPLKIGLVLDKGGKDDKSFIE